MDRVDITDSNSGQLLCLNTKAVEIGAGNIDMSLFSKDRCDEEPVSYTHLTLPTKA